MKVLKLIELSSKQDGEPEKFLTQLANDAGISTLT